MPVLKKNVKVFIVSQLARFDTLKQVQDAVKEQFGLTLTHQHVSNYDPGTKNGERLSPELVALFNEQREAFKRDTDLIPIANKAVRLRMLQRAAVHFESAGNRVGMAAMIEQAAKEVHETYSSKRDVNVKGEVTHEHKIRAVPDDELIRKLAAFGVVMPGLDGSITDVPAANQAEAKTGEVKAA